MTSRSPLVVKIGILSQVSKSVAVVSKMEGGFQFAGLPVACQVPIVTVCSPKFHVLEGVAITPPSRNTANLAS